MGSGVCGTWTWTQTPPRPLAAAGAGAGPASGAAAGAGAGSGGRPRAAGAGRAAAGAGAGRARGPGAAAGAAGGAGGPAPAREGPAAGAGGPGEGLAGRAFLSALRSVTPARVASACDLHCGLTHCLDGCPAEGPVRGAGAQSPPMPGGGQRGRGWGARTRRGRGLRGLLLPPSSPSWTTSTRPPQALSRSLSCASGPKSVRRGRPGQWRGAGAVLLFSDLGLVSPRGNPVPAEGWAPSGTQAPQPCHPWDSVQPLWVSRSLSCPLGHRFPLQSDLPSVSQGTAQ